MNILVVDDHEINREFIKTGLGPRAARVAVAAGGAEAVSLCESEHFDVVLLDLHMPRLDGVSTARRIRALDASSSTARMIILTADTRPEERDRLLQEREIDQFLNKPISIADLVAAIEGEFDPAGRSRGVDARRSPNVQLINQRRALAAANDNAELTSRLQRMLADDLDAGLGELDALLEHSRWKEASDRLHQWAGAAGYAGAERFGEACRRLRRQLRHDLESSPGAAYVHFLRTAQATYQALLLPAEA